MNVDVLKDCPPANRWPNSLPGGTVLSHIVEVKTQVRDHAAVAAACRRLALPEPVRGTAELYSGDVSGLIVRLPEWEYAVVIDTDTGTIRYDNYSGRWGMKHISTASCRRTPSSRPA